MFALQLNLLHLLQIRRNLKLGTCCLSDSLQRLIGCQLEQREALSRVDAKNGLVSDDHVSATVTSQRKVTLTHNLRLSLAAVVLSRDDNSGARFVRGDQIHCTSHAFD